MKDNLITRAIVRVVGFPYGVGFDDVEYVIQEGKRMSRDYPRVTYDFIGSQAALKWFELRCGRCDDVWDPKRKYATYLFLSNVVTNILTN